MSLSYFVELSPLAVRQLKKIPKSLQKTIIGKIERLDPNIISTNIKKLKGIENLYRLRVGDYMVIYQIKHRTLVILALSIGHRKDVYNNLSSSIKP